MTDMLEAVARDRADWLLDAVATATQDRRFLRGDPEYDEVTGDAILANGEKAIVVALSRVIQPEIDRRVAEEKAKLLERFDEDELEQIISNSLDMDWLPRDAARAIRQAMLAQYEKEQQP